MAVWWCGTAVKRLHGKTHKIASLGILTHEGGRGEALPADQDESAAILTHHEMGGVGEGRGPAKYGNKATKRSPGALVQARASQSPLTSGVGAKLHQDSSLPHIRVS